MLYLVAEYHHGPEDLGNLVSIVSVLMVLEQTDENIFEPVDVNFVVANEFFKDGDDGGC